MPQTAPELLATLRTVGLMTDVVDQEFLSMAEELRSHLGCGFDDPFFCMCVVDEIYGFDLSDEAAVTARCVRDRVLMFNEFHETDTDAFARRVRAVTNAVGIEVQTRSGGEDLPYDEVVEFTEALTMALGAQPLQPFLFDLDSFGIILFREHVKPGVLPSWDAELNGRLPDGTLEVERMDLAGDPRSPKPPWWKFWAPVS